MTTSTVTTDLDASDLGWGPGVWPAATLIDGDYCQRLAAISHHGEFAGFIYYHAGTGRRVRVWND